MFNKQKPTVINLMRDKEVVYKVISDKKHAEMQSASGDWSVSFTFTTFEYGIINYFIKENALEELHELCRAQYATRMMFHDAKLIKEFYKEVERAGKRMVEKQKAQDDKMVLAEEKVLHEKTEKAVTELETIRKNKKK